MDTCHAVVVAKADQLVTLSLLNHFLKLRAENLRLASRVARLAWGAIRVNKITPQCDVKPIPLFTLDGEFVGLINVRSIQRIASCLATSCYT